MSLKTMSVSLKTMAAPDALTPHRLPPGPRGLPLLGFKPFLSKSPSYLGLGKLARKYGDVCYFQVEDLPTVVVSHPSLMIEAFDRTEIWYLGAGRNILASYKEQDTMENGIDSRWRLPDQFAREQLFGRQALEMLRRRHLEPLVDDLVERVLELASRGETLEPLMEFESLEFNLTFRALFGCSPHDSAAFLSLKSQLRYVMGRTNSVAGALNPSDLLSWLKRYARHPEREAESVLRARDRILFGLLEGVRHRPDFEPSEPTCLSDIMLAAYEAGDLNWREVLDLCADFLAAAPAGLGKTLSWLLLLLTNRPEVQAGVHEEMDRVIGWGASPGIKDRGRLPWTFAAISESMRYRTVVPLSQPRRALQEMELRGYRIPAGSLMLGNIYSIHHDDRFWDAPNRFDPERFLSGEGQTSQAGNSSFFVPLGTVRRPCTGRELAEDSVWLLGARLLNRLKFEPPCEQPLLEEEVDGPAVSPKPFALKLSVR